ncbi:hypothetical protein EV426DRAFT_717184 [Tirmania nivea]|nr:hypothetical protein EV426DRAFT_717184 [Tirmania nivea]
MNTSGDYGNFGAPGINVPIQKTVIPRTSRTGSSSLIGQFPLRQNRLHVKLNPEISVMRLSHALERLYQVSLFPRLAATQSPPSSPALDYDLYLFTQPAYGANITVYLARALNQDPSRPLKYSIQLDDNEIQTIQYISYVFPMNMPAGCLQMAADGST